MTVPRGKSEGRKNESRQHIMSKVVIIKDERGFTVAEESNYTYDNEATARAFSRDKWGDENPVVVTPVPDTFRDGWSNK